MHLESYHTFVMDSNENFYILLDELSKYANESSAVSDIEEKKGIIILVLTNLNRSLSSNGMTNYFLDISFQLLFVIFSGKMITLSQKFYLFYKSMFLRVFAFSLSLYLTRYVPDQVCLIIYY